MAGYFHVSFLRLLRLQNEIKIALYIFGYRLYSSIYIFYFDLKHWKCKL